MRLSRNALRGKRAIQQNALDPYMRKIPVAKLRDIFNIRHILRIGILLLTPRLGHITILGWLVVYFRNGCLLIYRI